MAGKILRAMRVRLLKAKRTSDDDDALGVLATADLVRKAATGKPVESDDAAVLLVQRGDCVIGEVLSYIRSRLTESTRSPRGEDRGQETPPQAEGLSNTHKELVPLLVVLGNLPRGALTPVRAMAKDPCDAVRVEMVAVLGATANTVPEAVDDVVLALVDPAVKVRTTACHRLGLLKNPGTHVVAALKAAAMGQEAEEVRLNEILALATLGEEMETVLPFLAERLRHSERGLRVFALMAAEKAGEAALPIVDAIAENLAYPEPWVRRLALIALVAVGGPKADIAARVTPLTEDPDPQIREIAGKLMKILE